MIPSYSPTLFHPLFVNRFAYIILLFLFFSHYYTSPSYRFYGYTYKFFFIVDGSFFFLQILYDQLYKKKAVPERP